MKVAEVVKIEKMTFGYDDTMLLTDVDLTINQGQFWGIVGPNGSAKSTFLKLILGLIKPNAGSCQLLGTPVQEFNQWSKIGYIPQNVREFNMGFPATVEEIVSANLISQMGVLKWMTEKHKKKLKDALEIVGMQDYAKRQIGKLSGGQQQRVFIARTLVNSPQVIFMDEPLVGVDFESQEKFYALMEKLNQKMGITLVMVSHDVGVISERTSHIACMGNGKIYVHDSQTFRPEEYLESIYGEKTKILRHKH